MKKLFFVSCVFLLTLTSIHVNAQEMSTFYSEVDYRIAKGFIDAFQASMESSGRSDVQGMNLNAGLTAAIENAQFQDQYKVNGVFHGTRVSYGLKAGEKVAVVLPTNAQGRISEPEGHDKVYVVDLPAGFTDPCPPLCD